MDTGLLNESIAADDESGIPTAVGTMVMERWAWWHSIKLLNNHGRRVESARMCRVNKR